MNSTLRVQAYFAAESGLFGEEDSVFHEVQLRVRAVTSTIHLPLKEGQCWTRLRIDPHDGEVIFELTNLAVYTDTADLLYQWDGSPEALENGAGLSTGATEKGAVVESTGADPHFFVDLPAYDPNQKLIIKLAVQRHFYHSAQLTGQLNDLSSAMREIVGYIADSEKRLTDLVGEFAGANEELREEMLSNTLNAQRLESSVASQGEQIAELLTQVNNFSLNERKRVHAEQKANEANRRSAALTTWVELVNSELGLKQVGPADDALEAVRALKLGSKAAKQTTEQLRAKAEANAATLSELAAVFSVPVEKPWKIVKAVRALVAQSAAAGKAQDQ